MHLKHLMKYEKQQKGYICEQYRFFLKRRHYLVLGKCCLLSNRFLIIWFMWRVKVNELSCVSFKTIKGIEKSLELWKTMAHSTYIPNFYVFFLSPTQKLERGISDNWKELMWKYDYTACKRSVLGDLVTVCDVLHTQRS